MAAVLFARGVWNRRASLARSLSVLELSATIIGSHPALLMLSLGLLIVFLAVTAPFLLIFVRLFLLGHFGSVGDPSKDKIWHTDGRARAMAWVTLGAWLWTWSVLRGIQRVTVAGVISHWYFHREEDGVESDEATKLYDVEDDEALPGPAPGTWLGEEQSSKRGPSQIDIVRASFVRASGPALGTICLSAFVLALAKLGSVMASTTRWINRKLSAQTRFPAVLQPMAHVAAILAGISTILQGFSDYALIYVGVTGDGFAAAARRSARLVSRHNVKTIMEGERLRGSLALCGNSSFSSCPLQASSSISSSILPRWPSASSLASLAFSFLRTTCMCPPTPRWWDCSAHCCPTGRSDCAQTSSATRPIPSTSALPLMKPAGSNIAARPPPP